MAVTALVLLAAPEKGPCTLPCEHLLAISGTLDDARAGSGFTAERKMSGIAATLREKGGGGNGESEGE